MDRPNYMPNKQQYIDQMILYASNRKSQQNNLKSVALNAIDDKELEYKKVEYMGGE